VKDLKTKRANPELVGDIEVYAHAARCSSNIRHVRQSNAIEHAFTTLDQALSAETASSESAAMESRQAADSCLHLGN